MDINGADNIQGAAANVAAGNDDLFTLQSTVGQSVGAATLAPVLNVVSGLPETLAVTQVPGVAQSPAIDRANPASPVGQEPVTNGGFRNLGAFGGTVFAAQSPAQFVLVTDPRAGENWQQESTFELRWRADGFAGTVDIAYSNDGVTFQTIATGEANDGSYDWAIPSDQPLGNTVIRISATDDPTIQGLSDPFGVTAPISIYYVNDASTVGDQYSMAAGAEGNDGLSASSPMLSLRALLEAYDLGAGDVVLVDTGIYELTTDIVLDDDVSGTGTGDAERFLIQGPTAPGAEAIIDRTTTGLNAEVFAISGDYITISDLTLVGGQDTVQVLSGAESVTLDDLTIRGMSRYGIQILPGAVDTLVDGVTVQGGSTGIWARGTDGVLRDTTTFGQVFTGIDAETSSTLEGVVVYNTRVGIDITGSTLSDSRVFNTTGNHAITARSSIVSNVNAHNNANTGLYLHGTVSRLTGGEFYNNRTGVQLDQGAQMRDSSVYANRTGVFTTGSSSTVEVARSRIYDNTSAGIVVDHSSNGRTNIRNNVIYGDTPLGITLRDSSGHIIGNNTFALSDGVAITAQATSNLHVSGNIFDVPAGSVFAIENTGQAGFHSGNNLFHVTGTGSFGRWGSLATLDLNDWFFASGTDPDARLGDPGFADRDGADDVLGWDALTPVSVTRIENGDPGYAETGTAETNNTGSGDTQRLIAAGSSAIWTFDGLTPGDSYRFMATWDGFRAAANLATYIVRDGQNVLAYVTVNQEFDPVLVVDGETRPFADLGIIRPVSDQITVELFSNVADPALADAVRIEQLAGDRGADDDFTPDADGLAADGGPLFVPHFGEPLPNGGRVDIGATGGTEDATPTVSNPVLQILSPNRFDKIEAGVVTAVDLRSSGVQEREPVALINLGNTNQLGYGDLNLGFWGPEGQGVRTGGTFLGNTSNARAEDPDAGPAELYTQAIRNTNAQTPWTYDIDLPDGEYVVRVHTSTWATSGAEYSMLIDGVLALDGVDTVTAGGGRNLVGVTEATGTVSDGNGLTLTFQRTGIETYFHAIEIYRVDDTLPDQGTVRVEASIDNGATWTAVGTGVALNRFGHARFDWTPDPAVFADQSVQLRAVDEATDTAGAASLPIVVANNGRDFFINDGSLENGQFTTAIGDNSNTGKTADSPLASLAYLLEVYDLEPGDRVFVDAGTYLQTRNAVITADDAGDEMAFVEIIGPDADGAEAIFDRQDPLTGGRYPIHLLGADYVRLSNLTLTGGSTGLYLSGGSQFVETVDLRVEDNGFYGLFIEEDSHDSTHTRLQVIDTSVTSNRSSFDGAQIEGDRVTLIDAEFRGNRSTGLDVTSQAAGFLMQGGLVVDNPTGVSIRAGVIDGTVFQGNGTNSQTAPALYLHQGGTARNVTVESDTNAVGVRVTGGSLLDSEISGGQFGVLANSSGLIQGNLIHGATVAGLRSTGTNTNLSIYDNEITGAPIGIELYPSNTSSPDVRGNLVHGDALRVGLLIDDGNGATITNNTFVLGAQGEYGIRVFGTPQNTVLRNNILSLEAGTAISWGNASHLGRDSDYNLFDLRGTAVLGQWEAIDYTDLTDWYDTTLTERHSLIGDPRFINIAGDDFRVGSDGAGVDRGDPIFAVLNEPLRNGNRINIGAYGNTANAAVSPDGVLQVLSPNGDEKLEAGETYEITFRASGVQQEEVIFAVNGGSNTAAQGTNRVAFVGQNPFASGASPSSINVANFAGSDDDGIPDSIWRSFQFLDRAGETVRYTLPVDQAGTYELRFHSITTNSTPSNFDVIVNGETLVSDFDTRDLAGGQRNYGVSGTTPRFVHDGDEIVVEFQRGDSGSIVGISGFELIRVDEANPQTPTFTVEVSTDGGTTYVPVATGVELERSGHGRTLWTAGPETAGATALIRVTQDGAALTDVSDIAFRIGNGGRNFYVNDASLDGDIYTTAIGDNANTGKTAADPVADLGVLIARYDLQPGDTIWIDSGFYVVDHELNLTEADSGDETGRVVIRGAGANATTLTRTNGADWEDMFQFLGADYVTIQDMSLTEAFRTFLAPAGENSDHITLSGLEVSGATRQAVSFGTSNDALTIRDSVFRSNGSNSYFQVDADGTRTVIEGGRIFDGGLGLSINGLGSLVDGTEVFGHSSTAVDLSPSGNGDWTVARNLIVRDNAQDGVNLNNRVILEDSLITNNGTNVDQGSNTIVRNNVISGASGSGIDTFFGTVQGNRIFDNATGISGRGGVLERNQVYSNATGIFLNMSDNDVATVRQNLIYGNTNTGLIIDDGRDHIIYGNTILQPVGTAVLFQTDVERPILRNNIIQTNAGTAIEVTSNTTAGYLNGSSDFNLFFLGQPGANIGRWAGTAQAGLADWRAVSGEGGSSIEGDPLFLDIDGADNVAGGPDGPLGGGSDDNFNLNADSPAIDAGTAFGAFITDFFDRTRQDDPSTDNTGIGHDDFAVVREDGQIFAETGTALSLRSSQRSVVADLPFDFTYHGTAYSSVHVTTEGFLQFGAVPTSVGMANTQENFLANRIIAPFWTNLTTVASGRDVFVETVTNGADDDYVRFRWVAQTTGLPTTEPVNFSVSLFRDGRIRFDYGGGNLDPRALVGLSAGNGETFVRRDYPGTGSSLTFTPQDGLVFFDIGAFEFQGDSGDVTAPVVTAIPTLGLDAGGLGGPVSLADAFTQITVQTSESLELVSARSPANYELREAGPDRVFDTGDDIIIALTPTYAFPENDIVVLFDSPLAEGEDVNGNVVPGEYRLTLSGTLAIYDTAGNALDGDGDGTAGGDFVQFFTIDRSTNNLPVASDGAETAAEDGSVVITLTATDADDDALTYAILTGPANGTLSNFDPVAGTVTYTPDANFNGTDSFRFGVGDGKLGSDDAVVTISVSPDNDAPVAVAASRVALSGGVTRIILSGTDVETAPGALRAEITAGPTLQGATLTRVSDLVFDYSVPLDVTGADSFSFTVRDTGDPAGDAGSALTSAPAVVSLQVEPGNTAPVLDALADRTVSEGEAVVITPNATDAEGDGLSWSLIAGPTGASIDPTTGVVTWTVPGDVNTPQVVTIEVTDDGLGTLSARQSLTLTPQNLAPSLMLTAPATVLEDANYAITVSAVDAGGDAIDRYEVTWGDGRPVETFAGNLTSLSTTFATPGSYTISVVAVDVDGGRSTAQTAPVTVAANAPNRAPVVSRISGQSITEGGTYQLDLSSFVSDPDGDDLVYRLVSGPVGATIDAMTGRLDWQVPSDAVDARFVVEVSDTHETPLSKIMRFRVATPDIRSTVTLTGPTDAVVGQPITLTPGFVDLDGDAIDQWRIVWGASEAAYVDGTEASLTHSFDKAGLQTVRLIAIDETGKRSENVATLQINVTDPASAPDWSRIPTQRLSAGEDLSLDLLPFVTDPDGDLTSIRIVSGPEGASVDPMTNRLIWDAPDDATGRVRVQLLAEDAMGRSDRTVVTLRLPNAQIGDGASSAPVWVPVVAQDVTQGEAFTLDLSALVSDPDGDQMRYDLISGPAGMQVNVRNGLLSWTPANDSASSIEATIRATEIGASDRSAELRLRFRVENPGPAVTLTGPATIASGEVLSLTPVAVDPDGDALAFWRVDWGDGTREIIDGSVATLTHTYANPADARIVTVSAVDADGRKGAATQIGLRVTDGDAAPVWTPVLAPQAVEGVAYTLDLSQFAADPDGGALGYRLIEGAPGVVLDLASGVLSWTPVAGGAGNYDFFVEAAEPGEDGQTARERFTIRVLDEAPAGPSITVTGATTITAGAELSLTPALVDPANDTLTRIRVLWGDGSTETIQTPSGAITHRYVAPGEHVVRITPFGPDGAGEPALHLVQVEGRNQPPVWTPIVNQTTQEGETFTLDLTPYISDPDQGDSVDLRVLGGPEGMAIDDSGVLRWTAPNDFGRNVTVRIEAVDADLHDPERAVTRFALRVANPAPEASVVLDSAVVDLGTAVTIRPSATDVDGDGIAQWRVRWGDGINQLHAGSLDTLTHQYRRAGTYQVTLTAIDGDGRESDAVSTAVRVEVTNQAPSLTRLATQQALPGEQITLDIPAQDPNPGSQLTYRLLSGPAGASIDAATGQITWDVPAEADGLYRFTVAVSDDDPLAPKEARRTYNVSVDGAAQGADAAPVWTSVPRQTVDEGSDLTLDLTAFVTDPAGAGLRFELVEGPSGLSVTLQGQLSWTAPGDLKLANVTVRAVGQGADGSHAQIRFGLTVRNVGPVATLTAADAANLGADFTLAVAATDAGGDDIQAWLVNWGDGTSARLDGALDMLSHRYADSGEYRVSLRAVDAQGRAGDAVTHRVTISNPNAAPVWQDIPRQQVVQGQDITLDLSAFIADAEGDAVTLSLLSAPEGATLSQAGLFRWSAPSDAAPLQSIRVLAREAAAEARAVIESFALATIDPLPQASMQLSQNMVAAGAPVSLTPGATDADGDAIARYLIDWGDGTRQMVAGDSGPLIHRYASPAQVTAQIWAFDSHGKRSAPESEQITINRFDQMADFSGLGTLLIGAGSLGITTRRKPTLTVEDVVTTDADAGLRFVARLDAPADGPVEVMYAFRAEDTPAGQSISGTAILPRGRTELVLDLDPETCREIAPDGRVALDLFGLSGAEFDHAAFRITASGLVAGAVPVDEAQPDTQDAPRIVWG